MKCVGLDTHYFMKKKGTEGERKERGGGKGRESLEKKGSESENDMSAHHLKSAIYDFQKLTTY